MGCAYGSKLVKIENRKLSVHQVVTTVDYSTYPLPPPPTELSSTELTIQNRDTTHTTSLHLARQHTQEHVKGGAFT